VYHVLSFFQNSSCRPHFYFRYTSPWRRPRTRGVLTASEPVAYRLVRYTSLFFEKLGTWPIRSLRFMMQMIWSARNDKMSAFISPRSCWIRSRCIWGISYCDATTPVHGRVAYLLRAHIHIVVIDDYQVADITTGQHCSLPVSSRQLLEVNEHRRKSTVSSKNVSNVQLLTTVDEQIVWQSCVLWLTCRGSKR